MIILDNENEPRDTDDYDLSKEQLEMLKNECPNCGGRLYPAVENVLWCDSCLISVDSSGGYIE